MPCGFNNDIDEGLEHVMYVGRLVCGCACVLGMEANSSRIQIYEFLSNEWNRKREMPNNWRGSHGSWPD